MRFSWSAVIVRKLILQPRIAIVIASFHVADPDHGWVDGNHEQAPGGGLFAASLVIGVVGSGLDGDQFEVGLLGTAVGAALLGVGRGGGTREHEQQGGDDGHGDPMPWAERPISAAVLLCRAQNRLENFDVTSLAFRASEGQSDIPLIVESRPSAKRPSIHASGACPPLIELFDPLQQIWVGWMFSSASDPPFESG
jgi:hypothetical protein